MITNNNNIQLFGAAYKCFIYSTNSFWMREDLQHRPIYFRFGDGSKLSIDKTNNLI